VPITQLPLEVNTKLIIATNDEPLTRKDLATTFTRKLVFDVEPETAIPQSYRAVEEVVFGSACMIIACYLRGDQEEKIAQAERVSSMFSKCFAAIASTGTTASVLHVKMHMVPRIEYSILRYRFPRLSAAIPIIFEFFDVSLNWVSNPLKLAYEIRAVVHFDQDNFVSRDEMVKELAGQISEILRDGKLSMLASQVYLCDVPQLVLRPDELNSADDTNEAAMVKICSLIDDEYWPDQVTTPTKRLEFLKSRVKLVESGFRPTLADMIEIKRPG
jgi:hypothetical protein